jgi:hypothetical protein
MNLHTYVGICDITADSRDSDEKLTGITLKILIYTHIYVYVYTYMNNYTYLNTYLTTYLYTHLYRYL